MRFDEILQNDSVLDGLWDMHFDECTPIQEKAIPLILQGKDLLACAQTGTGKTAAYLLPIIDMLAENNYPEDSINCVIMAPTRELVQQIDQQLQGFSYFMPVSGTAIYGGTDGHTYEQQRKSLNLGTDIVIATPGRMLAHMNIGSVDLSKVSFFILDEADRMLDMGFYNDIMQIYSHLPETAQVLLFSATMPQKINKLAKKILKKPSEIRMAVSKPADKIKQSCFICYEKQKLPLIRHIFKTNIPNRVIIFSSSKLKVKELSREMKKLNFAIEEMHSDLEQEQRDQVMIDFKSGKIKILVATDIVARGIDVDDIETVINYDAPRDAEDYVHRVGRTARADKDGKAITFVSPEDFRRLAKIEKLLKEEITKEKIPSGLGVAPIYERNQEKKKNKNQGKTRYRNKNYKGRRDKSKKAAASNKS